MNPSVLSPYWYRVAALVPQLRDHVSLTRQTYEDEIWYVLHDQIADRQHRLSTSSYAIIGLANGSRSVQKIWDMANNLLEDEAPTQDEIIQLLGQLHAADVLMTDITPDCIELFNRGNKHSSSQWKQRFGNPLAIRVSLSDPDKFLNKSHSFIDPLFSLAGLIFWLVTVSFALVLVGMNWTTITEDVTERILAAQSLIILVVTYPVVKLLHELGHAFAVKKWGGEVHELGILFLVFIPIPYVNASAASAFRARYQRVVVGSAGIFVDLFLASLALLIWLNVESGMIRTAAFNVMFICGIATLFFNGNPLLRFDGYYIFADAIGIPNLAARSKRYLGYLSQKYIFSFKELQTPALPREQFWFVTYGISSFLYRIMILVVIVLFVAQQFFFAGVLIAIWAVLSQLLMPLLTSLFNLVNQASIRNKRRRTYSLIIIALSSLVYLFAFLPAPLSTVSEGVVWIPENAHVRAKTNGFVSQIHIASGSFVEKNEPLISTEAPLLSGKITLIKAQLNELTARYNAEYTINFVQAKIIEDDIKSLKEKLLQAEQEQHTLNLFAPRRGVFVIPGKPDIENIYLQQGDLIAYIIPEHLDVAKVMVSQAHIGLIREQTRQVLIKFVDRPNETYSSAILRTTPAAKKTLPSAALGTQGGGVVAIDPSKEQGTTALEYWFEFDISLPHLTPAPYSGSRVRVSFIHDHEPLARQWYRSIRQLLLKQFEL